MGYPYATHGAGIVTIIYLQNWVNEVNVGIHIPAPWSIWEIGVYTCV
jgi:hypothetical protein